MLLISTEALAQFDTEIEAYATVSRPFLNSVLVFHSGVVISEHYWRGFAATSYQPVFSITKSVVSALIGIAFSDKKLKLSDTLAQWFPEMALTVESQAAFVTIQHLLTMSAGFQKLTARTSSNDPIAPLVKRGAVSFPREKFRYANEDVDLLVAILERAIGESALEYAHRRLFSPLGIWFDVPKSSRKRLWKVDKQGRAKGGFGLHLTTHELMLFGQLYLQKGKWQDEQLLPPEYVVASTIAQISGGYPEQVKYGYLWWISTDKLGHHAFFASGAGGQYMYVLPELELIVVLTATSKNMDGRHHRVMVVRLITNLVNSINPNG